MKRILFLLSLCLISFATINAQTSISNTKTTVASPDSNVNYRLYQTNNRWTFLKLDTRTGIIMHVQYSTDNDAMQYNLNNIHNFHISLWNKFFRTACIPCRILLKHLPAYDTTKLKTPSAR